MGNDKNNHHYWVWLVPIGILSLAVFPWPYGYYQLLRVIVCVISIALFIFECKRSGVGIWSSLFLINALIYNPIIPIHLDKAFWFFINVISVIIFMVHFIIFRKKVDLEKLLPF